MNIDVLNKWLQAGSSVAVILGVIVAVIGAVVAINTLKETQKAASATLILQLRDTLEGGRYKTITDAIQNNDSAYPLRQGHHGKFHDIDVEEYVGNFEDIGYLIHEDVILPEMAYDHFSYDIEKAWCNADLRQIVHEARAADRSSTAATDPFYGNFEKIAEEYLAKEHQTCKDIENQ
jgi:hypothetical protein